MRGAYHDAEAQAERASKENVTVLYAKVALAWNEADEKVDADDAGSEDAG